MVLLLNIFAVELTTILERFSIHGEILESSMLQEKLRDVYAMARGSGAEGPMRGLGHGVCQLCVHSLAHHIRPCKNGGHPCRDVQSGWIIRVEEIEGDYVCMQAS